MIREVVAVDLPQGTWLGLECGHPNPATEPTSETITCGPCDRRQIPPSSRPGRQTPVFDRDTVPAALLGAHKTNGWAELVVLEGRVEFHEEQTKWHTTATPGRRVVIVPKQLHHIEPGPTARFYVQFHDLPHTANKTCRPRVAP